MKPRIDGTAFASITVEGTVFEHAVIIRPDGQVKKRKNKLSKAVYGTSHTTLEKAKYVCGQRPDADRLIVGVESAWSTAGPAGDPRIPPGRRGRSARGSRRPGGRGDSSGNGSV